MAHPENVTEIHPAGLPVQVTLGTADRNVRFTPRELELIKDRYGRSLSELIADDSSDDKLVVLAWLKLRREGYPVGFDQMADVVVELGDTPPDPTNGATTETSLPSATSGE